MVKRPKTKPTSDRVVERVEALLDGYLKDPEAAAASAKKARRGIPGEAAQRIDEVLAYRYKSYRDGIAIQVAFGLEDDDLAESHTRRPEGGRSAAKGIGALFSSRHIEGVVDAYQNVAKNTEDLCRGNVLAFDDTLRWLDGADATTREAVLEYTLARTALTARNVLPLPDVATAALTFHRCALFLDELLGKASGGAYEQFACAAALHAVIEEAGQGGRNGLRVDTKKLNATDASSKVPGDIQIVRGQRVEEAFEVTANEWREKVAPALRTMKEADLPRMHILARVGPKFPKDARELEGVGDLSVIDVATFLHTLYATMRKPARAVALVRTYELLERYQPETERVNEFVRLLVKHELTD